MSSKQKLSTIYVHLNLKLNLNLNQILQLIAFKKYYLEQMYVRGVIKKKPSF